MATKKETTSPKTSKKEPLIAVEPRKITGRKVKSLRDNGILPANIFGRDVKSQAVELPLKEFENTFEKYGETTILYLEVKGEKDARPVLVSNLHVHPVTGDPLHVDFRQVDLSKKVTATVPVELVGTAPAEEKGAIIVQMLNDVEVEALPTEIPDKIEVDISSLEEIGGSLTVADLKYNKNEVTLSLEEDQQVVQAQEQKEEEEPEPVETEGEEAAEGEVAEGETPSEGEDKPADSEEKAE